MSLSRSFRALAVAALVAGCALPPPAGMAPGPAGPAAGPGGGASPTAALTPLPARPRATASIRVKGAAHADGPLEGATVRVYDPAGTLLAEAPRKTTAAGTFAFDAPELVGRAIRVKTSGGMIAGKPFAGVLEAGFDDFDPGRDLAYCHPAATVAVAYQAARGGTMAAAAAATNRFLGLPSTMHRGTDHGNPHQRFFREALFVQAAGGAFDAYVAKVAGEVAAGGTTTRYRGPAGYRLQQGVGAAVLNAAKTFGTSAAGKAVLSSVAGAAVNYALAAAGLDPATNDRKEILAKLDELGGKLDQLGAQLHDIDADIQDFRDDVTKLINALNQADARRNALSTYTSGVDAIGPDLAYLATMWDTYEHLVKHQDDDGFASVVDFARAYDAEELKRHLTNIDQAAAGRLGSDALLDRWARVVGFRWQQKGKYPYLVNADYFKDFFATPDALVLAQFHGVTLYEELLAAQRDPLVQAALRAGPGASPPASPSPGATTAPTARPTPSEVTALQSQYQDRVAGQRAKLWCGDMEGGAAQAVIGAPVAGLLYPKSPMEVNVRYLNFFLGGTLFPETLTHFGMWDGTVHPAPATLPLATFAPGGQTGAWRWPTPAELDQLGKDGNDAAMPGLVAAGFDFSAVPHYDDGRTKLQRDVSKDHVMFGLPYGIWSSGYRPDEPMAQSVVAPADPKNKPEILYCYATYPPAALLFMPVLPLKADAVAGEFTAKL